MCKCLLLLLACFAAEAAVIKGNVVENQTGKALARTLISIRPVPGGAGPTGTTRTNIYGMFEFSNLPAGAYLIHSARRGFRMVQYGQKSWRGAGVPVVLEQEQSTFLTIRMPRFASISGVVVDENDVGLPEHEVVAMSNTRPPRMMARAQADDRGVYRLTGLDPGTYLVRTVGRTYEDGGYLPTFYRETQRVDEAGMVDALLDDETGNIRVRPIPGRLFNISGVVNQLVTLTLVSDVGRETQQVAGAFQFPNKPPGPYELFAESVGDRGVPLGAYIPISLERDTTVRVPLLPRAGVRFDFRTTQGGQMQDASGMQVLARRVDLAGEAPPETVRLVNGNASFIQGRWQFKLAPSAAYVAADFRGPKGERPESNRADGWNEVAITNPCGLWYVISDKPGEVHGTVTLGASDPAVGAPVFLEAFDEITHKRVVELRATRTDLRGKYTFAGLAPGTYRVVSTFEYEAPDVRELDSMSPKVVKVEEARDQQLDLSLFVIR